MTALVDWSTEAKKYAIGKLKDPSVLMLDAITVAILLNVSKQTVLKEIRTTGQIVGIDVFKVGGNGHPRIPAFPLRKLLGIDVHD